MRRFQLMLMIAALAALCATAQTTAPFSIRAQQGTNVQVFGDGGTLSLPAEGLGLAVEGSLVVTYTAVSTPGSPSPSVTINQITLTGSTDFSISGAPDLGAAPLRLTPQSATFGLRVRFQPTSSRAAAGKITVAYMDSNSRAGSFTINLAGTAPEFAYTYAVLPNGNSMLLAEGDTVPFPSTNLLETSAVQIALINKGSGQGTVNAISYTGSGRFALAQVPFLPAAVDPGKEVRFAIHFTPDDWDPAAGAVEVNLAGRSFLFKVQGEGLGAYFEYELMTPTGFTAIDPGAIIKLPDAVLNGEKSTATLRVWNTGNIEGRIAGLNVSGANFALIESPFMPYTLQPDNFFTFKLQFSPTEPGKAAGRLRVGQDNFELESNGLGPNLTYAYSAAEGSVPLAAGGSVVLPPAKVGESSTVRFVIRNQGTAPQEVFSISVTGAGTAFTLSGVPALPHRLAPDAAVELTVNFAPAALGSANATLNVDTERFTLTGVGNPPAALPAYAFQGASGTVEPGQQPAVGLTLAEAYPLAVSGTLNLAFTSEVFANDPAVQFASGGRSVAFTVPAGSRQAVFANNATQVRLQTGTVAGVITLTPVFATQTGSIDLTPPDAPALALTVPQSAPRLLNVALSNRTANGFTLLVTGYATGRSITQMDFQFTGAASESFANTRVTVPVETTFNAWYQSAASAQFGSQFTATVPFTLTGEIKDTDNIRSLSEAIQSVSVTLTNRQGVSTARSVELK